MTEKLELIKIDIDVPVDEIELSKVNEYIKKLVKRFKVLVVSNRFNKVEYDKLDDDIIRALISLGKLSSPAFDVFDSGKLEREYFKTYKHSPALAKKLWLEHYDELHYQYDLLKNRCYTLISDMNEELNTKIHTI